MTAHDVFHYTLGCLLLAATPLASAQEASRIAPTGAETKTHAGAGQIASRGAPANYYNPANLTLGGPSVELYGELDFVAVDYAYKYPGYSPVKIHVRTPDPYIGLSAQPIPGLFVAFSGFALPAGKGETLHNFPTRKFASDSNSEPILLDVETGGKGVGYVASFGIAYQFTKFFSLGLSFLTSGGTSTLKASEANGGAIVDSEHRSRNQAFVWGSRWSLLGDRLAVAVTANPPSESHSKGTTKYPALDAEVQDHGSSKGPIGFGAAASYQINDAWRPFLEYQRRNWRALSVQGADVVLSRAEVDYYNTDDVMLGADAVLGGRHFIAAAGFFESELGDGVMASEAGDGEEKVGLEFQDVEAIGHQTYALGYRMPLWTGELETGLTYLHGVRDVSATARGYGHYELSAWTLVAGGNWRL